MYVSMICVLNYPAPVVTCTVLWRLREEEVNLTDRQDGGMTGLFPVIGPKKI